MKLFNSPRKATLSGVNFYKKLPYPNMLNQNQIPYFCRVQ